MGLVTISKSSQDPLTYFKFHVKFFMLIEETTQMIYFKIYRHDQNYHFCKLSYDNIEIDLGCLNKEERQSLIESLEDAIYQLKD